MLNNRQYFRIFPEKHGFFPYVFLIYLGFPLYYTIIENGWKFWLGMGLIILFVLSYRQLYWDPPTKIVWLILQMIVTLAFTLLYSPFHIMLGFFPANFIGWFIKKKEFLLAYSLFLVVTIFSFVLVLLNHEFSGPDLLTVSVFVVIMFIVPFGIRSMNMRTELEQKLDEANEQIKVLIKREERMRIARDLHDTLGHSLSLITLQSQLIQKFIEKDPYKAKDSAREIEKTSRAALRQVRELVSDMRTTTIVEALSQMEQILSAARIEFMIDNHSEYKKIPLLEQNIISMCLREAATNVVKHSKAKICKVSMETTNEKFVVRVVDDGQGFSSTTKKGNGINGMIERLAIIEGSLTIETNERTILTISIPLVTKNQKEEIAL